MSHFSHHGHYIDQCAHGVVVEQCRCASNDKSIRIVACPPSCGDSAVQIIASAFPDAPLIAQLTKERDEARAEVERLRKAVMRARALLLGIEGLQHVVAILEAADA